MKLLSFFHLFMYILKSRTESTESEKKSMSRILIVEDEPRIASFMEKGLQKQGFKTSVVTNGQQGLLMAQTEKFDLLILDIGLPIMDGYTVLHNLRSEGNEIPVIIVTSTTYNNRIKTSNFDSYINKPFHFKNLLEEVYNCLPLPKKGEK